MQQPRELKVRHRRRRLRSVESIKAHFAELDRLDAVVDDDQRRAEGEEKDPPLIHRIAVEPLATSQQGPHLRLATDGHAEPEQDGAGD